MCPLIQVQIIYYIYQFDQIHYYLFEFSSLMNYHLRNNGSKDENYNPQQSLIDPYINFKYRIFEIQSVNSRYYFNIVKKSTCDSQTLREAFIYIDFNKKELIQTKKILSSNKFSRDDLLNLQIKQKIDLNQKYSISSINQLSNCLYFKKQKVYDNYNHIIKPQFWMILQFYNRGVMEFWLKKFNQILQKQEKDRQRSKSFEYITKKTQIIPYQKCQSTFDLSNRFRQQESFLRQKKEANAYKQDQVRSKNYTRRKIFDDNNKIGSKQQINRQAKSYQKPQKILRKQFHKQSQSKSQTEQKYQKKNFKNLQIITKNQRYSPKMFFQQQKIQRNFYTPKYQNNSYNRQQKTLRDFNFDVSSIKIQKKHRQIKRSYEFSFRQFLTQLKTKIINEQIDETFEYLQLNYGYLQQYLYDQELEKQKVQNLQNQLYQKQRQLKLLNDQVKQIQKRQCQKSSELIKLIYQQGQNQQIHHKKYKRNAQNNIRKLQQDLKIVQTKYKNSESTLQKVIKLNNIKFQQYQKNIRNVQEEYLNCVRHLQQQLKKNDSLKNELKFHQDQIKIHQDNNKVLQNKINLQKRKNQRSKQQVSILQKKLFEKEKQEAHKNTVDRQLIQNLLKQKQNLQFRLNQMQIAQNQEYIHNNRVNKTNYEIIKYEKILPIGKNYDLDQKYVNQSITNQQNSHFYESQIKYSQISNNDRNRFRNDSPYKEGKIMQRGKSIKDSNLSTISQDIQDISLEIKQKCTLKNTKRGVGDF